LREYCGVGLHGDKDFSEEDIPDIISGLSSNCLIVRSLGESSFPAMKDLFYMLDVVTLNWALVQEIRAILTRFLKEVVVQQNLVNDLRDNISSVERIGTFLQIIEEEVAKENYTSNHVEGKIYSSVWRAWQGDQLVSGFRKLRQIYDTMISHMSSEVGRKTQERLNLLALAFTIVTSAGVGSDLVELYDKGGTLEPWVRLGWVGGSVAALGIIATVYLADVGRAIRRSIPRRQQRPVARAPSSSRQGNRGTSGEEQL
jgi:hypothetical protein